MSQIWQWKTFCQNQGQRSHKGHTMYLHTFLLQPMDFLCPYIKVTTARSNQGHTPTPRNQWHFKVSISYKLQFLRHSSDKISKIKVTTVLTIQYLCGIDVGPSILDEVRDKSWR